MNARIMTFVLVSFASSVFSTAYANAPYPRPVLDMLRAGSRSGLFADVLNKSSVSASDFSPGYTTFLVERDSLCSSADKKRVAGINRVGDARSYVFNHAFKGDLTISKDGDRIVHAAFFPNGPQGEQEIVDEMHPLTIQTMGGDKIAVRVINGRLYFGNAVALEGMTYGTNDGSKIELDRCGDVSGAK